MPGCFPRRIGLTGRLGSFAMRWAGAPGLALQWLVDRAERGMPLPRLALWQVVVNLDVAQTAKRIHSIIAKVRALTGSGRVWVKACSAAWWLRAPGGMADEPGAAVGPAELGSATQLRGRRVGRRLSLA